MANTIYNPLAKLTSVPKGGGSDSGIPSISNTRSAPATASHIDRDLAYIRSLGPGPLPWEEAANALDPTLGKPNPHMTGPE